MPVNVTVETTIAGPVDAVAAFAADPDNAPRWYANIKSVEWLTPRPVRLGSQVRFVAEFMGRRLAYVYEVVEFDLPKRFVMRTAEGPFPMETTYAWEPAVGGTRMTLRNRGEPSGFGALAAPFMATAMRRATRKDLAALKALLEAS
jgi:hypothetical protein